MNAPASKLSALTALLVASLAAGAVPASAQPATQPEASRAAETSADTLRQRLEAVADRAHELAQHFRQMEGSVRQSPELQEEAGWASAEAIGWSGQLAALTSAVANQAAALDDQLDAASGAGGIASRSGMEERLARLRGDLGALTAALESMRDELEQMQGVVHGEGGHGHGH